VRRRLQRFVEVYVDCPLSECERRDVKGMYALSRAGRLRGFTGVDAPYEAPSHPEVTVRTQDETVQRCVDQIVNTLRAGGYLSPRA
jgi:adenylylsulfate kinase-like enzyme